MFDISDTTKLALAWTLYPTLEVFMVSAFRLFPELISSRLALLINDVMWFAFSFCYNTFFILLLFTKDIPTIIKVVEKPNFYVSEVKNLLSRDTIILKNKTKRLSSKSSLRIKTNGVLHTGLGKPRLSHPLAPVEEIERTVITRLEIP